MERENIVFTVRAFGTVTWVEGDRLRFQGHGRSALRDLLVPGDDPDRAPRTPAELRQRLVAEFGEDAITSYRPRISFG